MLQFNACIERPFFDPYLVSLLIFAGRKARNQDAERVQQCSLLASLLTYCLPKVYFISVADFVLFSLAFRDDLLLRAFVIPHQIETQTHPISRT